MSLRDYWLYAAAALILLMILPGCATAPRQLPPCEPYQFIPVTLDSGEVVFVLNQQNAVKLVQMVKGLNDGTCVIR